MMNDKDNCCSCKERINHIKCEVSTCCYNNQQDCCTADIIEVAPTGRESSESSCVTFTPMA